MPDVEPEGLLVKWQGKDILSLEWTILTVCSKRRIPFATIPHKQCAFCARRCRVVALQGFQYWYDNILRCYYISHVWRRSIQWIFKDSKTWGILILSMINKARLPKHLDLPLFFKHRLERMLPGKLVSRQKIANITTDSPVRTYFIPNLRKSLQLRGFTVLEYRTIPLELLTLFGREIFTKKIGIKIAVFFNKFSYIPFIGSFGGMCIFKARKNLSGARNQSPF